MEALFTFLTPIAFLIVVVSSLHGLFTAFKKRPLWLSVRWFAYLIMVGFIVMHRDMYGAWMWLGATVGLVVSFWSYTEWRTWQRHDEVAAGETSPE